MTNSEMVIPNERLREIAEVPLTDYEDLAYAVRELAAALLERSLILGQVPAPAAAAGSSAPPATESKRLPGKPLGEKLTHPCRNCGADVVTFVSQRTNRPYQCDVEMDYYKNVRQLLTGRNWLHVCPERKG